jgi:hypothetical protein
MNAVLVSYALGYRVIAYACFESARAWKRA